MYICMYVRTSVRVYVCMYACIPLCLHLFLITFACTLFNVFFFDLNILFLQCKYLSWIYLRLVKMC